MVGSMEMERVIGGKPRIRVTSAAGAISQEMCSQKSGEDRILVKTDTWRWPEIEAKPEE